MKRFVFLSVLLVTFFILFLPAKAKSISQRISPGMDVLWEKWQMEKSNLCGSQIRFTKADFEEETGEMQYNGIQIVSLPDKGFGTLFWKGTEVDAGKIIPKDELNLMVFLPADDEAYETRFTYRLDSEDKTRTCRLTFTEEIASVPTATGTSFSTYQNVALTETVSRSDESFFYEITSPCKKGALFLNTQNGTFVYTPRQNEVGKDSFSYRICDRFGNESETVAVYISIEKAKQNLYFYDMAKEKDHNAAIWACSAELLSYDTDENGFPVFHGETEIRADEWNKAITKLFSLQEHPGVFEQQIITKADAYTALTHILADREKDLALAWSETEDRETEDAEGTLTREALANLLYKIKGVTAPRA